MSVINAPERVSRVRVPELRGVASDEPGVTASNSLTSRCKQMEAPPAVS